MKSSGIRKELLLFCPLTVLYASPLKSAGYPAAISAFALSSSLNFPIDIVNNLRVVDVKDDHFGGASRCTAGLDTACPSIKAFKERKNARTLTAAGEGVHLWREPY